MRMEISVPLFLFLWLCECGGGVAMDGYCGV